MSGFKGIENINGRKIKQKEIEKMAEVCLSPMKKITLTPSQFFSDKSICSKMFTDTPNFYVNPTERLIIGDMVSEGNSFATVLGSGDFALDAVYHGAKDVLTFDINRHQLFMADLKMRSLEKLGYDEFWDFFSDVCSDKYFSPEIYQKIKSGNNKDNLFWFWDHLMKAREADKNNFLKEPFFGGLKQIGEIIKDERISPEVLEAMILFSGIREEAAANFSEYIFDQWMISIDPTYKPARFFETIKGMIGIKCSGSYNENEESYNMTRERLKNTSVSFIKSDISCLKNKVLSLPDFSGFQSIYLSNISEYMPGEEFISVVKEQLMPLLKDDGSIFYCCQGMNLDLLTKATETDILELRNKSLTIDKENFILAFQEINDIEGYQGLRNLYDLSTTVLDTACSDNGFSDTDIYVRVKKH